MSKPVMTVVFDHQGALSELAESANPCVSWNAARLIGLTGRSTRQDMLDDPRIKALCTDLLDWPGEVLNSHKSARQCFHKLAFLADAGLETRDSDIHVVVERILSTLDSQGIPGLPMNISEAHGGDGTSRIAWALCDAPVTMCSLVRMGVDRALLEPGITSLAGMAMEWGWPCGVSAQLEGWRGPGKKSDPCPYATLVMTKLLAACGGACMPLAARGARVLLDLWTHSREKHPYMFYMGTDFRKLKLPFVWYDILHVADVLSMVPDVHGEPAFLQIMDLVASKATADGTFVPESVWQPWSSWDFGQKKHASEWMRLCVARMFRRWQTC